MLAVPGRGEDKQDCLSSRVQLAFSDALIVHRLDMATSGLLIFARGIEMQRQLSEMFRERSIQKRYVAIITGRPETPQGEIDLPICADWPNRPKQRIDFKSGKPSLTRYRQLSHDPNTDTSRLELEPVTGRTHQLRVHLEALGHAIVGDRLYNGRDAQRLMLHAEMLTFNHPSSGCPLTIFKNAAF